MLIVWIFFFILVAIEIDLNTFRYSTLIKYIVAPSSGSVIGAAFGGAVFGSILTVIVFVCIGRRSHSPDDSKE